MPTILATWNEPGEVAIRAAAKRLERPGTVLDAIEQGLATAEDDPRLVAIGRGALPNAEGELELDASVMEGREQRAGAVCAMKGILPAISVARLVMEETPHLMLAGDQAKHFAMKRGFVPQNLLTAECIAEYEKWRYSQRDKDVYVHTLDDHDTITMLGREDDGHLIAASSTSGLAYKLPGRVGDSPIVGAGIYADDEIGAAGATGWGEELWRACSSFRTVQAMGRGLSPQEACEETMRHIVRRHTDVNNRQCVVLALNRDGEFGAALNVGVFHLWILKEGSIECRTCLPIK